MTNFFITFRYNNAFDDDNSFSSIAMTFGLSLAAALTLGFIVYKYTKKGKSQDFSYAFVV